MFVFVLYVSLAKLESNFSKILSVNCKFKCGLTHNLIWQNPIKYRYPKFGIKCRKKEI